MRDNKIIKSEIMKASEKAIDAYIKLGDELQVEVIRKLREGKSMGDALQSVMLKEELKKAA